MAVVPLVRLPTSAVEMTASSVAAGLSLVEPALSVPVPGASGSSTEGCELACSMTFIAFLV